MNPEHPQPETEPAGRRLYRLYGRVWECSENLDHLLPRASGPPEFRYRLGGPAEPGTWSEEDCIYRSPIPDPQGNPRLRLWREGGTVRAFFSGVAAYHLSADEIVCHPLPDASRPRRDNLLLGAVMAFWMELRGLATLHAAAVAAADHAVGFVSHSGGGKSSLAALMVASGWRLLTDDVLPLQLGEHDVRGWPGYPMMRMWPSEARHFAADGSRVRRVHPATPKLWVPPPAGGLDAFCDTPMALRRLYFPVWRKDESEAVEISPLSSSQGLIHLVRYSFAPLVARALGLDESRFRLLSETALRVPLRRLAYPPGFRHLARLRKAIEEDCEET